MRKKDSSYSLLSDFRDCHDWAHLDDFRDFLAKMRKKGSSSSLSSDFRDCRDWAHLPPELVELISQRLKSITDYIRFRAVCYPWRAATASLPKPRHLPPQLPWIMPPLHWAPPSGVFFDDIWEAKNRTFHLPGTERRTFHFYGDDYPCFAVCTDDWGSLDRVSPPMKHEWGMYAWKCTVGSQGFRIYSAQRDPKVNKRDPSKLPLYQGGNITWFQPSLI